MNATHTHEKYGDVAIVSEAKGWITIEDEDGAQFKVRANNLTELELAPKVGGDVFPEGIRDTYDRGRTEDGTPFIDNGDPIATQLRGWSLEAVAKLAADKCGERNAKGWIAFYTTDRVKPLNPGMVRMNLGNRIRAAIAKQEKAAATKAA